MTEGAHKNEDLNIKAQHPIRKVKMSVTRFSLDFLCGLDQTCLFSFLFVKYYLANTMNLTDKPETRKEYNPLSALSIQTRTLHLPKTQSGLKLSVRIKTKTFKVLG